MIRTLAIILTLCGTAWSVSAAPIAKLSREEAYQQCKNENPKLVKSEMMVACVQRKMRGSGR